MLMGFLRLSPIFNEKLVAAVVDYFDYGSVS